MFKDHCLCASKECANYALCMRGGCEKRVGIYTESFLAEICNESNNYSELITKEDWYGKESNNECL